MLGVGRGPRGLPSPPVRRLLLRVRAVEGVATAADGPSSRRPWPRTTPTTLVALVRPFSTRGRRRGFQLDALPFSVTPSEARDKFRSWADDEQGLGPLLSLGSTAVTAAYAPFWYFEANVRFVEASGGRRDRAVSPAAIPEPLRSAYAGAPGGVVHLPGLAAYAGFSYRRSLIDPVHNTTPVFMKKDIVPFGQWMLEPLELDGQTLEVYPDPWNATRERAYSVVHDELTDMANLHRDDDDDDGGNEVRVETERLSSRRIYMPTYVVEYTILGVAYRAYLSGCDLSVQVSGVSHNAIFSAGSKGNALLEGASSFLSGLSRRAGPAAAGALQMFGLRPFVALASLISQVAIRVATKLHVVGLLGGAFVAWRKIFRPYMDERTATAEWERQRDHEAQSSEGLHVDSSRDGGSARAHFVRNEGRILRALSGEEGRRRETEGYEWYNQWEQWTREQWEEAQREASRAQEEWQRQQQQQGRTYGQYQKSRQQQRQRQQQQRTKYKQEKKDNFQWDFDANDPWSVLGIPRTASKDEVSKAFRREMLKHHPDLQAKASEKEKRRATERSKIISDAYRRIKASFKK
ncbi:hypothetical protein ACHAWF_011384 [Thalassiosira exigua]